MQGHRFRIRLLSVLVGGLLLVAPALWAQQPRPGGTLRVGWEADVTGLDPFVSPGVQAWHVVGMLFNSLLTIDVNLNFVPDLAESWDVLENGKGYVFHLCKGVTFHDGTDFDAEAALPTMATIMKTQLAKIGVEVTVEVIDRPIFLRRLTGGRDWDQFINLSSAITDAYSL